jgi:multidrug resistance efflux pump
MWEASATSLEKSHCTHTHTLIAGQLEAALALANQRIAELEAEVKALQGTVQGLQEALAAAQTQNATLQVLLCLRRACNVHKRPAFRTSQLPKVSVVTIMLGGRTIQAALTCFVGFSADQSRSLNQQLTAGLAFLVTTAQ